MTDPELFQVPGHTILSNMRCAEQSEATEAFDSKIDVRDEVLCRISVLTSLPTDRVKGLGDEASRPLPSKPRSVVPCRISSTGLAETSSRRDTTLRLFSLPKIKNGILLALGREKD